MKPTKDQKEYESYNYDAYNAAVDLVLAQHRLLNDRMKLTNRQTFLRQLGFVLLSAAVLVLALALARWLFTYQVAGSAGESSDGVPVNEDFAAVSGGVPVSPNQITENYVQYTSTLTSAGEVVVTAREFAPDDFETPSRQWCYLTPSTSSLTAQAIELSEILDGELITRADEGLYSEALTLCDFVIAE